MLFRCKSSLDCASPSLGFLCDFVFLVLEEDRDPTTHLLPVDDVGNCFFASASALRCWLIVEVSTSKSGFLWLQAICKVLSVEGNIGRAQAHAVPTFTAPSGRILIIKKGKNPSVYLKLLFLCGFLFFFFRTLILRHSITSRIQICIQVIF